MAEPLVDVVLPCLNEEAALPAVLRTLPDGYRAIVVDNGSSDESAAVARSMGALVVNEPTKGYGAACHAGLMAATAGYVAFCDADESMTLAELPTLAAPVIAGRADLSLGRRRPVGRGSWPLHARLANHFLAWRVRRSSNAEIRDIGPMRFARRRELIALDVTDRRSGYPLETVLRAAAAQWRIEEFPIDYSPRVGRSKVTGTVRGTITAVGDMSKVLARTETAK